MSDGNQVGMMVPMERQRRARPPILDMYEMAMRRTDVDFRFDFVKKVIISDKYWIDMAETEKETYGRYKNATYFILSCLKPKMTVNGGDGDLRRRYESVFHAAQACDPVEVVSEEPKPAPDGSYTYTLKGVLKIRNEGVQNEYGDGVGTGLSAPESKYDSAILQASENAYSMANCEAKKQYFLALCMAFEVGIVSSEEVDTLKGGYDQSYIARAMADGKQHQ
jgi:hypothetical protein